MNILIPHTWLLDQLSTEADPETIQRLVSLSGPSIERINLIEGESVYDIEVTTNRVDSMSIRGMAREIAVILQANGIEARLKPLELKRSTSPSADFSLPLPTIDSNPAVCKRIMCVILDKVEHTPTPDWMKKRLHQIDQREHDSVIDITNYVTHEYGHPIHAFDYEKIMKLGGIIKVVEAKPGKPFVTLDGEKYTTKGGEIVFENNEGEIIDLPAIKGTLNSAVDDNTKRVLLWVESLDAKKVRTASMNHAIRTVAAQLNEKNVDPMLAEVTLLKAIKLYEQLTHAVTASDIYDDFIPPAPLPPITISLQHIEAYLGIPLTIEEVSNILTQLECQVEIQKDELFVTPPSFRPDLQIGVDIIEEIARLYGYHNLPSVLMTGTPPTLLPAQTNFAYETRVKRLLASLGCQEIYTYSLVSADTAVKSGYPLEKHLVVSNPLTDDHVYLRRALIPSLVEVFKQNSDKKLLTLFEFANTYHPSENDSLPTEDLHLAIVSHLPLPEFRRILERMLRDFYISITSIDTKSEGVGDILAKGAFTEESTIGEISLTSNGLIAVDLVWKRVLALTSTHPNYQPIPKSAPIIEDLTFSLQPRTAIGLVIASIQSVSPLITSVQLLGTFENRYTFRITYQDPIENLSSAEIAPLRLAIVKAVESRWGGQLVGSLE